MTSAVPKHFATARRTNVIAAAMLIGALALWYFVVMGIRDSAAMQIELPEFVRNVAAGLFLIAGAARFGSWRLTRDPDAVRVAVVLVAMGSALLGSAVLGSAFDDSPVSLVEAPESRLLVALPLCLLVVTIARRNRQRLVVTVLLMATVTVTIIMAVSAFAGIGLGHENLTDLWILVEGLSAAGWVALGYVTWTRHIDGPADIPAWAVAASMLMAMCEVLKAWSLAEVSALHGMSAGFQLCAGAIIAVSALRVLGSQYSRQVVDDQLGQRLLDRRDRIDGLEREQRERLHDARSVVLGVKGATSLLADERFASHVRPEVLQQMMSAELERLQHLLDTGEQAPCVEFDVRAALRPVLVSHRLNGARIRECVDSVTAVGRPMDTATVVDNLLRNVARHAPGAAVTVSARRLGAHIEIVVEDDGPGIPVDQRARVLLPGVRGDSATSPGSGLGLSNSARIMAEQVGTLRIGCRRHGGTRIVLALPAGALLPADAVLAG